MKKSPYLFIALMLLILASCKAEPHNSVEIIEQNESSVIVELPQSIPEDKMPMPGESELILPEGLSEEEQAIYRFVWDEPDNKPFIADNWEFMSVYVCDINSDGQVEYIISAIRVCSPCYPRNAIIHLQNGELISAETGLYGKLPLNDNDCITIYQTQDSRRIIPYEIEIRNGGDTTIMLEFDVDEWKTTALWEKIQPYDYDPNISKDDSYWRPLYFIRDKNEYVKGRPDSIDMMAYPETTEKEYSTYKQKYWDSLTAIEEIKVYPAIGYENRDSYYAKNGKEAPYPNATEENQKIAAAVCDAYRELIRG